MKYGLLVTITLAISVGAWAQTCKKAVAIARATPTGVLPSTSTVIEHWWKKNAKHYPDICFSQTPLEGAENFVLVISTSESYFNGVNPVVHTYTNTSTTTTPFSSSGTVTDNYGGMWQYTANGTLDTTTTTTTTVHENVPYMQTDRGLYLHAYDQNGSLIASAQHIYSSRSGGDGGQTLGYNLGSLIAASGARGHMIKSCIKAIEKQ